MSKPYRIGYVAGVFDLGHIGHLNLLRRAKEHCDYLIVGVVSDRQVRENKKVEPFIPFNERLDMVRSCKFVDEAHEIPFETPDTDMAWKLYRFDAQFSGSDYEKDPAWLAKQKWLRERGADMVFFPYTETTSSTRLKKLIEERLI
ncbi:MAG: adenylyltransferase/cytidyltransferase family protein [Selenomonadaceae bacterium]|nr:adenylyltransferase/cytidyltransferase family protein [Selenomonadaceae bacterium]